MRFFGLTACLLMLALVGCQNSGKRLLSGHWVMETPDQIREKNGQLGGEAADGAADKQEEIYNEVADGEITGRMELVFHSGGKLETITDLPKAQSHKVGSWRLISFDEGSSTAVIECQLQSEKINTAIEFLSDNRIKLVPPNIAVLDKELIFRREK